MALGILFGIVLGLSFLLLALITFIVLRDYT